MSKNVVIIGANRGIGLAFATSYKAQGNEVYACCREASEELEALGVNIIPGVEVTSEDSLVNLAKTLANVSIDVLICNAGIMSRQTLDSLDYDAMLQQFKVNALGPIQIVEKLRSHLKHGSKIAMITSRMGSMADNTSGGSYGYRMSKAALNAAAKSLAHDLVQEGICVGIYHPGYVKTRMVNFGGLITPKESAAGIMAQIEQLNLDGSGTFKHTDGQTLPW